MSSERARELRQQGIAAAKAGNKDEARSLLQQSIRLDPGSEAAWLWLASVARDQRERSFCLRKVLEINPGNDAARQALAAIELPPAPPASPPPGPTPPPAGGLGLKKLGSAPAPEPPHQPPPAPSARPAQPPPQPAAGARRLSTQEMMSQPPGVPLPTQDSVNSAYRQAELALRERLAPQPPTSIKWVRKSKRRAGEGDIVRLRLVYAAAAAGLMFLLVVVGAVIVLTNDDLRSVVIAPTRTFTNTPTATPTSTPGVTPTPSPQPRSSPTPSPQPPISLPRADPNNLPPPTAIYPPVFERPLQEAIVLLNRGQVAAALPTIVAEVGLTGQSFSPNPYYYQAMALLEQGDFNDALDVLEEAEGRLDEAPNSNFAPLINSGYAQVYLRMAQDAQRRGDRRNAEAYYAQAQDFAEAAIQRDPRLDEPYLVLARCYAADRDYLEALRVIDRGLNVPDLSANTLLLVEKGEIYRLQREYDLAQYQAFLALYVDPTAEAAYQLQIRTALDQRNPGQAVLYAQTYLHYYPGSQLAYLLLGQARIAEGNYDLALIAFDQALTVEDTPQTPLLLEARGRLYSRLRRFDAALADFTEAFTLTDDLTIRAERMQAAYDAGRYSTALQDAEALLGRGVLPDAVINLLIGRATIDRAAQDEERSNTVYTQALTAINQALGDPDLPEELRPYAQEYAARANLALGNYTAALNSIQQAIAVERTASRIYLRGQIYQAQRENFEARRDYEWVLAFAETYPLPFRADVEERLAALSGT
ncbi:MAG: tetratricopeptide repeat protein [Candidatus Flexifilum sp.]